MHRELLVVRHGKSDWSHPVSDFERPLNSRGEREAGLLGDWLEQQGLQPDLVFSSTAQRARRTAEILCTGMAIPHQTIHWHEPLYMADVEDLLQIVRQVPPDCHRLMLIGHNPGLEELVMLLADEDVEVPDDGKLLPTATVAGLYLKGRWKDEEAESCSLIFVQRGQDLEGQ